MSQVALYRKYRSQTFDDVVGQQHVVKTLQESIRQGRIGQAYLFTGPRGTGKTSVARLLAKALNAEGGPNADFDPESEVSKAIATGNSFDVIEIDAASEAGVEEVREKIVEAAEYKPTEGAYRVFIIDEVHDLSNKGFDALLKTIEEPPPHAVFVLATTEYHKVPPTIRSRCQRFDFQRGTIKDIAGRLQHVCEQEGIAIEPAAIGAIARMADGGYRDALTLLEQAVITAEGNVTLQHVYDQLGLVDAETADTMLIAMAEGDTKTLMESLDRSHRRGRDSRQLLESLLMRLSELSRASLGVEVDAEVDSAIEAGMHATAARIGQDRILEYRGLMAQAHAEIRDVSLPRIWLESELIRIASLGAVPAARPEPQRAVVKQPESQTAPKGEPAKQESEPAREVRDGAGGNGHSPQAQKPRSEDPELAKFQEQWERLYKELSEQSKLAREKLAGSYVESKQGAHVNVVLTRQLFVDWVKDNPKIQQGINRQWISQGMPEVTFEYKSAKRAPGPREAEPVATVESPLQGSELREAAKEVFGMSDEEGSE